MTYRDLIVWQKSMDMVEELYKLIKFLPKEETYVLSDQMRRAAVSVPSNIAEGYARNSSKEYVQFLSIAKGSCVELETQLELAVRLRYFGREKAEQCSSLLFEIEKMLTVIQNKLRNSPNP